MSLDYDASPSCPGVDDFKAIVVKRLGADPFSASAPDRVFVRITTLGRSVEGRVEWRDEPLLINEVVGQAVAATRSLFDARRLALEVELELVEAMPRR